MHAMTKLCIATLIDRHCALLQTRLDLTPAPGPHGHAGRSGDGQTA